MLQRLAIQPDRRTHQQIFHREIANLTDLDLAVEDVAQVRQRLDRHLERLEQTDDRPHGRRIGRGNRNQHLVGTLPLEHGDQIVSGAKNGHAMNAASDFLAVVVDEANRLVVVPSVVLHVANDQLPGVAGAEDQDPASGLSAAEQQIAVHTSRQTQAAHQAHEQNGVDDEDRTRKGWNRKERHDHAHGGGGQPNACDDVPQIPDAGVPPDPLVQLERHERNRSEGDQPGQHRQPRDVILRRHLPVEAQQQRQIAGRHDQHKVHQHHDRAPLALDCEDGPVSDHRMSGVDRFVGQGRLLPRHH